MLAKYKKIFLAFNDLVDGLMNAQSFYTEMKDTVESLEKNVETFVSNRRSEGAQLLHRIEQDKASSAGSQADRERDRLQQLMERMSVGSPSSTPSAVGTSQSTTRPAQYNDQHASKSPPISPPYYPQPPSAYSNGRPSMIPQHNPASLQSFPPQTATEQPYQTPVSRNSHQSPNHQGANDLYNPMVYPYQSPASPLPNQNTHQVQQYQQQGNQFIPQGYVPPPPPPGPPPSVQGGYGNPGHPYPAGPGGYATQTVRKSSNGQAQSDPWAGLNAWK